MTVALERMSTGIAGLDDVLGGGLPRNAMYAVQGPPGLGKTTLGLQFLLAGRDAGEQGLLVTLSETSADLEAVASSHGWSLNGVALYETPGTATEIERAAPQTIFPLAEVELEEITRPLLTEVERVRPSRVVIDSVSEIRLLARDPLRYRREILALNRYFRARHCTVLLLDESAPEPGDILVRSVVHGVVLLDKISVPYGAPRRRVAVDKLRGSTFREGYHDFRIRTGGIEVYPRLVASEHKVEFRRESLPSGLPDLDALLGGGLDFGTSALFLGPAGVGKSTVAMQYAVSAVEHGHAAMVFAFDEAVSTLQERSAALGMDLAEHLRAGRLLVQQVDPAELSPGELSHAVRTAVETRGARLVVIDTLNGYFNSVPDEPFLALHLHELLTYLGQRGVATILVLAQQGLVGSLTQIPIDASYLADTVLLFRYFETSGSVRQAISVIKKRSGSHERSIREFRISSAGLEVGEPLKQFQGVLTGVPQYHGPTAPLLAEPSGEDGADR